MAPVHGSSKGRTPPTKKTSGLGAFAEKHGLKLAVATLLAIILLAFLCGRAEAQLNESYERTVGTTADTLVVAGTGRVEVQIVNQGATVVDVGFTTTSAAFSVAAGGRVEIDLLPRTRLYAKTAAGTSQVDVLETVIW